MAKSSRSKPGMSMRRRTFLSSSAAAAASVIAAPYYIRPAWAKDETLYINTWGGVWTDSAVEAFIKPFMAETGVDVKTLSPVSFAKLKAQVQTGNYEWDVTTQGAPDCARALKEDLLEPVGSVVDPAKLSPGAINYRGIKSHALATALTYRKDKFPNGGPQNWADFWNVDKFPGNRSMYNNASRVLPAALMADGVPRDKLYPLDLDRAFRKLDEIKPHVKVWWTQGSQSEQLLRDGEVDIIQMWNGRAAAVQAQGVDAEIVWNGAEILMVNWIVVRGTPRADLGWRYIQSAHDAERQAKFASLMQYGPANPKAFEYIDEKLAMTLPTWPANAEAGYTPDPDWTGENMGEMVKRFNRWLAS
ncbi:MAG: ABC transporter substrate-binding protein [Rhodospirillaceae bacterium]